MSIFDNTDNPVWVQGKLLASYPQLAPRARRGTVADVTVIGTPVLHRSLTPVTEFGTPELRQLIDDMFVTMYVAQGVGLAANQIGVDSRVFVFDCPDDDGNRFVGHIINPEITVIGEAVVTDNEGCLSVPGPSASVTRPAAAAVAGYDETGEPITIDGTGYFARCLAHETDHLNGTLYVDHLADKTRAAVLREMEKTKSEVFAERAARAARINTVSS